MKRTPIKRTAWQDIRDLGPRCEVRGCKRQPEAALPVCLRHAEAYLFNLSKLGELAPERQNRRPEVNTPPRHPINSREAWNAAKRKQRAWREACMKARPFVCVAAEMGGCDGPLECDHVKPKSQGGEYVVENGAFLCREHHRQKTDSELKYRRHWLRPDQIAWLEAIGWVTWLPDGSVVGRGMRHFEETR